MYRIRDDLLERVIRANVTVFSLLVQLAFCVSALTELEIIGISSSFKAETRLSWKSGGDFQREFCK
ncbi:hypothetical protein HMPREF3208_01375 [Gardnerella vaginalis]|uniref:Uncharacterized protein n=1 Tax=Gardnerella vaginalis TaxID=2702 RepID=A0A133NQA0_GARVA|nr:hypothetical protein HMPREF3208_01375 [Gardnerella vaginalis]